MDRHGGRPAHGFRRGVRLFRPSRNLPRTRDAHQHGQCGRRPLDLGALADLDRAGYDRARSPSNGRARATTASMHERVFARRPLRDAGRSCAVCGDPAPPPGQADRRFLAAGPQYRPRPRPVAHDDPHGQIAAVVEPYRGALRRDRAVRCCSAPYRAGDHRPGDERPRVCSLARADHGDAATGICLRAHALDRPIRCRRPN